MTEYDWEMMMEEKRHQERLEADREYDRMIAEEMERQQAEEYYA